MCIKSTLAAALLMAACGCGDRAKREATMTLDQVPGEAMAAATKALPGVKFERVQKIKVDGKEVYEIRGKDKRGKILEVEVTASGEVVAIE